MNNFDYNDYDRVWSISADRINYYPTTLRVLKNRYGGSKTIWGQKTHTKPNIVPEDLFIL